MAQQFPLEWPVGYPRTRTRERSRFKNATLGRCVGDIISEINRLNNHRPGYKDSNVVISSNVPLKNDGFPRADYFRTTIVDKGVAVYFKYGDDDVVLCCDRWQTVEENMRAIVMSIEAIRGIDRWGVSDFLKRSFTGFKELSAPAPEKSWWEVMQFTSKPSSQLSEWRVVREKYLSLAKIYHPDASNGTGTTDKFQELVNAFDQAKKFFNQ